MKRTIIEALKTKYKNLGFSEKAFDGVASYLEPSIKEEADIETAISGVEALLKAFQGEADSIRTAKAAAEKRLADLEAKVKELGGSPAPGNGNPDTNAGGDDIPAWAKALVESNKQLTERLNKQDADRTTNLRKQQLSDIIKSLPEHLRKPYERTAVDSLKDEEFTKLIADVETEVSGILADTRTKGAVFGRPAQQGGSRKEGELTKEQLDAITKTSGKTGEDAQPF